jgi:hypothetical protein
MGSKKLRKFDRAFELEAVRLVTSRVANEGRSADTKLMVRSGTRGPSAARSLEVPPATLSEWDGESVRQRTLVRSPQDGKQLARRGLFPRCAPRCRGIFPKRTGEILCVGAQAFTRTHDGLGTLIIERSGVGMPYHAQVGPGTTLIVVSDVAFADIAGQHENLSRWKEYARLTKAHACHRGVMALNPLG